MMIDIFSALETYNKFRPLTQTKIYSRLQGYINVTLNYNGKIITETTNNVNYNMYGKVFEGGECLLFPDDKCNGWKEFIKNLVIKEHEKELKQGNVCLVKRNYADPWVLAIYNQKVDKDYQAKVGKDYEFFKYCISFENNKEFLGRESFPEWLIDEPTENP